MHRFASAGLNTVRAGMKLGHVHGDSLVDIPLPPGVRVELVKNGEAEPHHVLPKSGSVSVFLRNPEDVGRAIRLLQKSYEIALASQTRSAQPA